MSSAAPWFKFFPTDWQADQALRVCSLEARGLWIECMCIMHKSDPYGHLIINGRAVTDSQLSMLACAPLDQVVNLLAELEEAGAFSRTRTGVIYSRRMVRDEKKAKISAKNGKNGGNPTLCKQTENQPWDNPQVNPWDKGGDNTQSQSQSQSHTESVDTTESESPPEAPPAPKKARAKSRPTSLPDDWLPSDEMLAWAKSDFPTVDAIFETGKFQNNAQAKGLTYVDWDAAWKNWIRKELQFQTARTARPINGASRHTSPPPARPAYYKPPPEHGEVF